MQKRIAILGIFTGDEGKGKIVHDFSPSYDWVVRFSGGANAGHTIYRDGKKYVHNLLPSVDYRESKTKSFLGSGMVIDLEHLKNEIIKASEDFPNVGKRIYIDPDAFLVLPEHKEQDKQTNSHIGTTNKGIGLAYMAKVSRSGKRIRDLFGQSTESESNIIDQLLKLGVNFTSVLNLKKEFYSQSIIFEGAQGVLLDLNHGIYPYVSCGNSTIGGIYDSGFAFAPPTTVYGVAKAYSTKVGEGPFPTELHGEEAEELRKLGNEYGAVTGRPRRVGWLDLPALRYAVAKGGITNLIITKLDILNGLKSFKVCDKYESKDPVCGSDFFKAAPSYVQMDGWEDATTLNAPVKNFIKYIEDEVGVSVDYISAGVNKENLYRL